MAVATPDSYTFTPGTPLYAGLPTPSVGGLITTLSLVNTSGSTQAANFVSPMLGMPFKAGDLPSGEYPVFTLEDDTPVPATVYSDTSWPDSSKKFCGVLLRTPTSIAGSGTLSVEVKGGGSAPAASSRTLSDLTAADITVELTGITNLSGVWTASLNTAITDATDIVVIGDGPAGKVWRIGGPFKQSGAAHGQLHCWHYVAALQNSVGGLLGIRYLGRIAQPWADVSSPTPNNRRATGVLKSGASTIRTLQGVTGSEVTGNNIDIDHYTSFFTAGADAKWDYVQGGGSASADCTVRVVFDESYFIKTRMVPPYDTALNPTAGSSVDYVAYCKGPYEQRNMTSSGPRAEVGILPTWVARHVLTQSAVDERVCRVAGLAAGGWNTTLRRSTTNQPIPCVDIDASYTGLGTIQTTWRFITGGNSGPVTPSSGVDIWPSSHESSHRPSGTYYPYLITGEPQYLDMLVEEAAEIVMAAVQGSTTFNTSLPITAVTGAYGGTRSVIINGTTYKNGGGFIRGDLYRVSAWLMRDLAQAAAIYPDTCPSGTAIRDYLRDLVTDAYSAVAAYNALMATSWRDTGMWTMLGNGSTDADFESPWALAYVSDTVCHTESILPGLGALAFRQHLAKFYSSLAASIDIASITAYRMSQFKGDGTRVDSTDDLVFTFGGTLTSSTTDSRFTTPDAWNPTNGDVFMFTTVANIGDADKPFAAATNNTRLYAVNVSGKTFQLSLTLGGSPITVTSNVTITSWLCRLQNAAPINSFEGLFGTSSMLSNMRAAVSHHVACGDSVASAARTEIDARATSAGLTYTADPKWAFVPAYPV